MSVKSVQRFIAIGICLLMAVAGLMVLSPAAFAADKPIKWRMQSVWAASSTAYKLGQKFCEDVKKETNGRMEISLYPPGGIVKPLETFDAVSNGAIQMGFSSGIYNARKIPEALVEFGMPFSFADWKQCYEFLYEYENGKAMELISEAYKERKIHLLAAGPSSSYGYMTKFPAKSLADFKGKKIRSFGYFGSLVKMMGGAPVSIPASEQYMALQRGTVEGTIYPYYAMETYNLKEVSQYIIKPPVLATPTINFCVNDRIWKKLPDDLKAIVSRLALEDLKWYSDLAVKTEIEAIKSCQEAGIEVLTLPESEVAQLQGYGEKIWAGISKKSDRSKALVDMLKSYLGR